jgi:PTS system nitrogen regulatory IIA component
MKASDFIRPENVFLDLSAPSKAKALQILAKKAGDALGVAGSVIFEALQRRENLGSTGVGEGVAIPHTPVPGLDRSFGCLARLRKPVAFDAIDGLPVDIVVVLLAPADGRKDHLNVLACVARRLRTPEALQAIRSARTNEDLYAALVSER